MVKTMRSKFSLVLLILLISFACEKKVIEPEEEPPQQENEFAFGNYTDMIVTFYDTMLIGGYHDTQNLNLDLDNDNIRDIRLISDIWGSPGLGLNPCSKIWSLNSQTLINGYYTNDTLFLNRLTSVVVTPDGITKIYEYYNYSCYRKEQNDIVFKVYYNEFKVIAHEINGSMNLNDDFKADSITLIDNSYSHSSYGEEIGTDSLLYSIANNLNDCNLFPMQERVYIGFKKVDSHGVERLGWIKLLIINKYKIFLMETAIQKLS